VKLARPSTTVILGGPQASVVDRQSMLAFPAIDFILRGEAEESLPALLDAMARQRSFDEVAGLTYRSARRILRNPNARPIADLDALPLPAYELYEDLSGRSWLPLEAGRGCPFSCRFCSTNDFFRRKFRLKSPRVLVGQMAQLSRRYGVNEFQLTHDMFTVDRKRVAEFCEELLGAGYNFGWRCSARTDCVDEQLLRLMARAGCKGMFFGIETGSQRLQTVIDKNLDLAASRRVLDMADRHGMETTASLITGYPQEQFEDLDGTVDFFGDALRLDRCDAQLHLLSPLAETPLETEYRDQLVYDKTQSDICAEDGGLDGLDELLVMAHPDVFPNFYALPCPIPRAYLRDLRAFLLALSTRAKGLAVALHAEAGGLRRVFDEWREADSTPNQPRDYQAWDFFPVFLEFVASRYRNTGCVAVTVLWRFYTALAGASDAVEADCDREPGLIRLRKNVRVVTIEGDVIETLACLREGRIPGASVLHGMRTLALHESNGRRKAIRELPPLSVAILERCESPVSESDLASRLTEDGVTAGRLSAAQYLSHALTILAGQGLLDCQSVR
jgi:radical SAM superfamily enzyme YgiQ (UPF0313 family)